MDYIDLHCDTLMQAWRRRKTDVYDIENSMACVRKLVGGRCRAQVFAIFLPSHPEQYGAPYPGDEAYIDTLYRIFENTAARHEDVFAPALSVDEIRENARQKKVSGILSMEDGRAVNGRPENIRRFYDAGVRILGLTWNNPNCFGFPNSPDPAVMKCGLTDFGKEAVPFLQKLGMGVDVSHLSDGGFWDVARLSEKPFIASHSNCRSLHSHPRNLADDMIRALAEKGGVMGVNFYPAFLTRDPDTGCAAISDIAAQLRHCIRVGGIECAAIGSDFDGFDEKAAIPDAAAMPRLFDELAAHGFTADELEHVAYKNAERVLKEML